MNIEMTGLNYQKKDTQAVASISFKNDVGGSLTIETTNSQIEKVTELEKNSIEKLVQLMLSEKTAALKTGLLDLDVNARKQVTKYKTFFGEELFKLFWSGNISQLTETIFSSRAQESQPL